MERKEEHFYSSTPRGAFYLLYYGMLPEAAELKVVVEYGQSKQTNLLSTSYRDPLSPICSSLSTCLNMPESSLFCELFLPRNHANMWIYLSPYSSILGHFQWHFKPLTRVSL